MTQETFEQMVVRVADEVFLKPNGVIEFATRLRDELTKVAAPADAVAKDAERYQWLKENCALGIKQNGIGWSLNTRQCVAPDCMKELDAAIDAAICSKEHELLTKREGKEIGK